MTAKAYLTGVEILPGKMILYGWLMITSEVFAVGRIPSAPPLQKTLICRPQVLSPLTGKAKKMFRTHIKGRK